MAVDIPAKLRAAGAVPTAPDPASGAEAPVPPSLRDTEVDGGLAVDAQGQFVATPDARVFFDYFLSASGEEPIDATRARVVSAIEARLPPSAAAAAIDVFDRYLVYREQVRDLQESGLGGGEVGVRFGRIHALRRQTLGDVTAEALFGEEEARDRIAILQRRIATDPTLPNEERERQLAALEAELPQSVREARAAAVAPLNLQRDEAALRASGGSVEEVRALREGRVGPEAAERLAELDRQRAQWRQRVEEYQALRAALEADPNLDADQRIHAGEALLRSRFTPEEQLRVQALERIRTAEVRRNALD